MTLQRIAFAIFSLVALHLASAPAAAQTISYTPTFSLPNGGTWNAVGGTSLDQLYDGKFPPDTVNGFAVSDEEKGTLSLALACRANLTKFSLWNNIVQNGGQGVTSFELRFYDGANQVGQVISQTSVSILAPQLDIALSGYNGVDRVEMTITGSATQIEIREIQLEGSCAAVTNVDPCCPPWNKAILQQQLQIYQPGNALSDYTFVFNPTQQFLTQMQAYVDYLHTVNPAVKDIVIVFQIFDITHAANPNWPLPADAVGASHFVGWNCNGSGCNQPAGYLGNGNTFLMTNDAASNAMHVNNDYMVQGYIYMDGGVTFWPETCSKANFDYRISISTQLRRSPGASEPPANAMIKDAKAGSAWRASTIPIVRTLPSRRDRK